jgi:hypothetical protein
LFDIDFAISNDIASNFSTSTDCDLIGTIASLSNFDIATNLAVLFDIDFAISNDIASNAYIFSDNDLGITTSFSFDITINFLPFGNSDFFITYLTFKSIVTNRDVYARNNRAPIQSQISLHIESMNHSDRG